MSLKSLRTLGVSAFLSMGLLLAPTHVILGADATQNNPNANTENADGDFSPEYIKRLSEAYGHLIQKSTVNPYVNLDFDSVIKGMQDAQGGKPSPMTEQEYEEAINLVQDYAYQKLAANNLKDAEAFMIKNAKESGVQIIEPGKLQFIILQKGNGPVVTEDSSPFIKYTGKYADGKVFGSSEDNGGAITISLAQTIPGFRKGLVGMQQGEKRRLFIHPDLGYGTSGQLLPNALLVFDVEVTEVKAPQPPQQGVKDAQNSVSQGEDIANLTYGPFQSTEDEAQEAGDDSDSSQDDDNN